MINGKANEFIDKIYTCQDIVFIYDKKKYWFQGYMTEEGVHMEVFQADPPEEDYIWEYNGKSISDGQLNFQEAKIFNGKTFWEVEEYIEWVDC